MRKSILVVDSNPTTRLLAGLTIDSLGYRCTQAGDGESALDFLNVEKYLMVISDINLQHQDGFGLLLAMHSKGYMADTSVVMVSRENSDEDRRLYLKFGASYVLPKPLVKSQLQAILQQICG